MTDLSSRQRIVIRLILPVRQIHAIPCSGAAGAYFRPELIKVLVPRVGLVVVARRRSCVDEVISLSSQRDLAAVAVCCITACKQINIIATASA